MSPHIFKRPLGRVGFDNVDLSTSVENEWLCSRIFRDYNLPVADCRIKTFGTEKVLVVKRFDRKFSADKSWIIRLPQEDFCQATGTPGALKYERDGGPGIKEGLQLLSGSLENMEDRKRFFKAQIVLWLLASPDGHAKNYSIFLHPLGRYSLTPFYDIISAWPVPGSGKGKIHTKKLKLAMAVRGESGKNYHWDKITAKSWLSTAKEYGFSKSTTVEIFNEVINQTPDVLTNIPENLPRDFPSEVVETILNGIRSRITYLE